MRSAWLSLLPVAALLGGCGVADTAAITPAPATASAYILTPTAVPTYDWQLAEMGMDAGPTPTLRPADATVEVAMNRSRTAEARIRATTLAITPQPKTPMASREQIVQGTPYPTHEPWPVGIYECRFESMDLHIKLTTCWHEVLDGKDQSVVAGGKNFDPYTTDVVRSALAIYHENNASETFWLPEAEGLLTITAVTWPHITVRSAIGKEHGFNAETLEWETPQATPTTPRPTGTPTP